MNKNILISIIFFTAIVFQAFLSSAATLFDKANTNVIAGNYSRAIEQYNQLREEQGSSPALFYNLARAFEENGQRGLAILNYSRAESLAPGDAEIISALDRIRKANGLFEEEAQSWQHRFTSLLNLNHWSELLLGALLCYATLQLLLLLRSVDKKVAITISTLCGLVVAASTTAIALQWQTMDAMIVISDSAKLWLSPIKGSDEVQGLREGRKVLPLKQHGDFCYVEDSGGTKGWVEKNAVVAVDGR
ncbi:MAG: tetratricopeptide repeat protein [Desulforhopalus sp.]|nr:tetratricopeptide repeat protein [Desulforhopalus sp.]